MIFAPTLLACLLLAESKILSATAMRFRICMSSRLHAEPGRRAPTMTIIADSFWVGEAVALAWRWRPVSRGPRPVRSAGLPPRLEVVRIVHLRLASILGPWKLPASHVPEDAFVQV